MTSPNARRRGWGYGWGAIAIVIALAIFAGSRASILGGLTVSAPAHLEMVNLCGSSWRIRATAPTSGRSHEWRLLANASLAVDLPGGHYQIEQTLLTAVGAADTVRNFSLRLDPGERYRWKLITLLTAPPYSSSETTANEGGPR